MKAWLMRILGLKCPATRERIDAAMQEGREVRSRVYRSALDHVEQSNTIVTTIREALDRMGHDRHH